MKKKLSVLFLISLLAFSLAACDTGGGTSKSDSSAVQTTAPQEASAETSSTQEASADDTAAPTEEATETTAEPTTEASYGTVGDYVFTKVEKNLPSNGSFLLTGETGTYGTTVPNRLPQLKLDSADAASVNSEIMSNHSEQIESNAASAYEHIQGRIDYVAFLNGGVLSLVIESRSTDTPNSYFDVYNFDVTTGNLLSKEEVIALSTSSQDEVRAELTAEINAIYDGMLENAQTDANIQAVENCRTGSLTEENLSAAQYYFNGEGQMVAAYRYKGVAGAESYGGLGILNTSIR